MVDRGLLHDHLGNPFGGAHHAGGTHRLVRRDQHEMLGVVIHCTADHVLSPEHVVRYRIGYVVFHQRHVLVRCGVEHGVRAVPSENAADTRRVPHIRDHGRKRECWMRRSQLVQDVEDLVFAVAKQHQVGWLQLRQLACQFAPDGAAGARDQD